MSANSAIVDDRDPGIQYVGTWNQAGSSEEFDSTTTWSSTQGTSASFTFVGTSVTVFGTVAAKNPPDATLGFAVDKTTTGSFEPASGMTSDIHHQVLWASPSLANGTHTLVITQTEAQATGVIYLDYIMYETTSDTAGAYFVDDGDPRIVYTPSWTQAGAEYDFLHTTHGSNAAGDSFLFTFQGKSISFYGDINNGTVGQVLNASMSIDKGPPVFFVPPIQPAAVTSNNLIYNSGDLSDGTHTLVVTAENAHPVWFDYLLVTPNSPGYSVSGSPTSGSTSTGSAPSGSSTASSLGSNSSTLKKKTPIGAIVGPVIGVLALVAIAALLFFWCRRRRQPRESQPANFQPSPFSEMAPNLPIASAHGGYSSVPNASDPAFVSVGYSDVPNSSQSAFASAGGSSSLASAGHGHNAGHPAALPAGAMYAAPTSVTSAGIMMHQLHPQPAQAAPLTPVRRHAQNPSLTLSDDSLAPASSPPAGAGSWSGPQSSSSSSVSALSNFQPPVSQIRPSSKLAREARETQRWNEATGITTGPLSPTGEAPPQYAE
ncbi:hypothetical protein C8F04DRAFT_1248118 [Mycena alexandri]|uniref:Uncharacterized protein n=1 Tax=Mycena alexandri TaxID=1745969 RepID=A0AAD6TI78_9AGAR|nr:hypothetical protein C8F04DRAFT_1248118 [Mycena alexandri]